MNDPKKRNEKYGVRNGYAALVRFTLDSATTFL